MSKHIKLMLVSIVLAVFLTLVSSTLVPNFAVSVVNTPSTTIEIAGRFTGGGTS